MIIKRKGKKKSIFLMPSTLLIVVNGEKEH